MKEMKNESSTSKPQNDSSLLEYIRCELKRGYQLQNDEQRYRERREKFYIFLKIPYKLETFLFYGFFQCVDAFLFVLTFLPFRLILALLSCLFRIANIFIRFFSTFNSKSFQTVPILNAAETCDILKGIILLASFYMMDNIEISIFYHQIKSQSIIKLYIFFNMLEVADKLLSSFGQDILDTLYWTATEPQTKKRHYVFIFFHLLLAIFYVFAHTILVLLQATTLNVAINSKNKALITIMMSNNFVELKSMVFKKFEKNNLFHMSCSDVRERLHYIVLLAVVIIQTMKEYNWSDRQLWILLPDCLMVFSVEIFVDWFKHAFVTRFNEISYDVYEDYSLSLAYDLVGSKLKSAFSDHSDIVSRRMGFIPLPLSVLLMRIFFSSFHFNDIYSCLCLLFLFLSIITFKLSVNIVLLGLSCKWVEEHQKSLEEKVNKALGGHSASLPASRHNSVSDLTILNEEKALHEIKEKLESEQQRQQPQQSPTKTTTKSTPHSPLNGSPRNSLEDISEQVAIIQKSLESSIILSDSTVSLISMNDGRNVRLPKSIIQSSSSTTQYLEEDDDDDEILNNENEMIIRDSENQKMNTITMAKKRANIQRRVSLQELPTNTHSTGISQNSESLSSSSTTTTTKTTSSLEKKPKIS
ncbi:Transmembrane anterior posterior transformation protein 1 [Dermatophagoides pteronyssinus]|uniref:Transmembrane anterior posterior transformation protein 1 n=2 Tax=Dermatophagoides pteronyssinus TaxID=6956 RepID=A0ABQ8JC73_DERPT|nr:transmembrane anterior posterior transformation protein 1 homolog [Dermatophagoides pteronyssinus]KAH9419995.1 Transmembrane anterior posterior transformation protein 1 [Dermatophagoides pteronyssinus]